MRPSEPCPDCAFDLAAVTARPFVPGSGPASAPPVWVVRCPACGRAIARPRRGERRPWRAPRRVLVVLAALGAQIAVIALLLPATIGVARALADPPPVPAGPQGVVPMPILGLLVLAGMLAIVTGTWLGIAFAGRRLLPAIVGWTLLVVAATVVMHGIVEPLADIAQYRDVGRGSMPHLGDLAVAAVSAVAIQVAACGFVPAGIGVRRLGRFGMTLSRRRYRRRRRHARGT